MFKSMGREVKKINKWAILGLFFGLFHSDKQEISQQMNVKKCPSNIRCWDSNSQPFEQPLPLGKGGKFICLCIFKN